MKNLFLNSIFAVLVVSNLSFSQSKDKIRLGEGKGTTETTTSQKNDGENPRKEITHVKTDSTPLQTTGSETIKPDSKNETTTQSVETNLNPNEGNINSGSTNEVAPISVNVSSDDSRYGNRNNTAPEITLSNPTPYPGDMTDEGTTNTNDNPIVIINNNDYKSEVNYYEYDVEENPIHRYTDPEASFMIGTLKTTLKYPERFNLQNNFSQNGFQIGSRYNLHKIEDISIKGISNIGINLMGSFSFGYAGSTDRMNYSESGEKFEYTTTHHTFIADLFSLSANAEYKANIFKERGIVLGMTVTFFNLGTTASYMQGGRFDGELMGIVNILPLYLQPYAKIKFLGGTLGLGLLLNPYNFAEFRFGPEGFWGEGESGFQTNSTAISRYAIEAYFRF
ncbi:MAG: hypothetical protein UZ04_CHB001000280 [Chlorobi bacterium OLB4]|jgi:hypothetical protein|nr:MAG: hypothetical protein UZ04_CHB001000280 [Chlorobi bacterium OLB4]MBW7854830.1 hypothetical protein [Ignavibacteria bacterium]OQY78411.1 MAG: hypothetical protein B6D43_02795 [Ignavibacteriales bacterium UTCHB1]